MPLQLASVGDIIRIKRRPETTLTLRTALQDPAQTVADYVFTDSIRSHFHRILHRVQEGQGQAFWLKGEYGGGKTHFLATLAALLQADERVWGAVTDTEIANFGHFIRASRLFPVVYSLRGEGAAGGFERSLFDVLEEQIELAARERLGRTIDLNPTRELLAWYDGRDLALKDALDKKIVALRHTPLPGIRAEGGEEAAAAALREAAAALGTRPELTASTASRLVRAYDLVVRDGGYNGLLVR